MQLGRIILLVDDDDKTAPTVFKSYKSRRATHFVLAAEVIDFIHLFYGAFAIKDAIKMAISNCVQSHLLTYSKREFYIISNESTGEEKRYMLDVDATFQGYEEQEISNN